MKTFALILTCVLVLSLAVVGLVLADSGPTIQREVLSGGATDSAAGDVALRATLGQPVAGTTSSGSTSLAQGFWHAITTLVYDIFLPLVVRN